jgi:glycosyltransferase involved in cell wall biosynthesis
MFKNLSGKSMIAGDGQAKVLHLSTSSGPGGAERVISTLAQALNDDRFRVIVGLFKSGWLQTECERLGVETRVIPLKGTLHMQWFRNCFRLVREERIALIHGHEFSAIVYGWIVSRLAGIFFVGTVHGKNYFWQKLRRRLAYRTISRLGQLVAVSEDLKDFIVKTVGIPASRVQVIYNGVESGSPVSDAEIDRCRAELGLSAGDPVIGTVGSLYPVKGHRYLLDAMPTILRQYPNAVLLLIGRGELEISLKEQTQRLGIEERVRFLGMRQNVPKLLAVMDVFVLPSLSEGLSLALLEAMASGKPVVATHVGGNSELIDHGRTGFLVQPEDARDLAANLLKLLSDPEKMQQFGRQAAERVRQHFSMGLMVDRYRDLYARALTVHNSGMNNK